MTKADLVGQVADAIGPGVIKGECWLVIDGFLGAVQEALARCFDSPGHPAASPKPFGPSW